MTVTLFDHDIIRRRSANLHTFKTGDFEDITVPLALIKGQNRVTLRYGIHLPVTADKIKRAVLFREISLLPSQ